MTYDFETVLDRRGKDSIARDQHFYEGVMSKEPIPMWVADMNFSTAPKVIEALQKRLEHPLFGYFEESPEYYQSIFSWHRQQFQVELKQEWIGYENGILGGIATALRALVKKGSPILVHSPTYIGFLKTLQDCGYPVILSPLKRDEQGVWRMDYSDMKEKIRQNHISVVLLCSPHNPCGRVWEKLELAEFMNVCEQENCSVISDEIWSDLTLFQHPHTPTYLVSPYAFEHTISLYAPNKTFNLAGLVGGYHLIPNAELRKKVELESNRTHYNSMGVLYMHALIGAYQSEKWLLELKKVLEGNIHLVLDFLKRVAPSIQTNTPEGTYLFYLECHEWLKESKRSMKELLKEGWSRGVLWQDGCPFGLEDTIRLNVALPRKQLIEALSRLEEVFKKQG